MKSGDICVVQVALTGAWPAWFFARIVECFEDTEQNWMIEKVRIVGEQFDRDADALEYMWRIEATDRQAAAFAIVQKQWGVKPYASIDLIRAAILELAP